LRALKTLTALRLTNKTAGNIGFAAIWA